MGNKFFISGILFSAITVSLTSCVSSTKSIEEQCIALNKAIERAEDIDTPEEASNAELSMPEYMAIKSLYKSKAAMYSSLFRIIGQKKSCSKAELDKIEREYYIPDLISILKENPHFVKDKIPAEVFESKDSQVLSGIDAFMQDKELKLSYKYQYLEEGEPLSSAFKSYLINSIARRYKNDDADERKFAIADAYFFPSLPTVETLKKAISDPAPDIRRAAFWALKRKGTPEAINILKTIVARKDSPRHLSNNTKRELDDSTESPLIALNDRTYVDRILAIAPLPTRKNIAWAQKMTSILLDALHRAELKYNKQKQDSINKNEKVTALTIKLLKPQFKNEVDVYMNILRCAGLHYLHIYDYWSLRNICPNELGIVRSYFLEKFDIASSIDSKTLNKLIQKIKKSNDPFLWIGADKFFFLYDHTFSKTSRKSYIEYASSSIRKALKSPDPYERESAIFNLFYNNVPRDSFSKEIIKVAGDPASKVREELLSVMSYQLNQQEEKLLHMIADGKIKIRPASPLEGGDNSSLYPDRKKRIAETRERAKAVIASWKRRRKIAKATKLDKKTGKWQYSGRFHKAIEGSNKIIIKGFHNTKILKIISNKAEINSLFQNITFNKQQGGAGSACGCGEGFPLIHWYKNDKFLAWAGVKHDKALNWKGFPGYGTLTKKSQIFLKSWLKKHGIAEPGK